MFKNTLVNCWITLILKNMGYQNIYVITAPFDEIKKAFG